MSDMVLRALVGLDGKTVQAQLNAIGAKSVLKVNTQLSNGNIKEVEHYVGRAGEKIELVNGKIQKVSESTNTAKTRLGQLGKDFATTTGKVMKFAASTAVIGAFTGAIGQAVSAIKEFDDVATNFKKVSTLRGDDLNEYAKQLGDLGVTVGRTRTEMLESATEFKKSGFNEEDAAVLSRISALYQNTADEELSAADATSVVISQMKAFHSEFTNAEDAIKITDAINKVSADFAVSSGDIGRGLTAAGAALSTYGNTFAQTIGLVTAGTEIFQGQSAKVARGLNTISARLPKNAETLQEYGVSVKDSNGQLKSTFDILKDLKPKWDEMSSAEKTSVGNALAGTNQYKVFAAVMNNFGSAVKSSNEVVNESNGETMKQNEAYMESLEAKINNLKAVFQNLVLGDGGISRIVKSTVDGITKLLQGLDTFFNTKVGSFVGSMTLIVSVITLATKAFEGLKSVGIVKTFTEAYKAATLGATAQGVYASATTVATGATAGFNAVLEANPIGIVIGLIGALVTAYAIFGDEITTTKSKSQELNESLKDYNQTMKDAKKAKEDAISDEMATMEYYGNLKNSLSDIVDENGRVIEGHEKEAEYIVNTLNNALGLEIEMRDGVIQNYKDEMQAIHDLIQKKQAEAVISASETEYKKALQERKGLYDDLLQAQTSYNDAKKEYDELVKNGGGGPNQEQGIVNSLNKTKQALEEAQDAFQNNENVVQNYKDLLKDMAEGDYQAVIDSTKGMTEVDQEWIDNLTGDTKEQLKTVQDRIESNENLLTALKGIKNPTEEVIDTMDKLADENDLLSQKEADLKNQVNVTNSALSSTKSKTESSKSGLANLANWISNNLGVFSSLGNTISNIGSIGASVYGKISKKASGGESKGGLTLVGEEGAELVASGNSAYLVGVGGAELTTLSKGDYVYTAKETRNMLQGKNIKGTINARKSGTKEKNREKVSSYLDKKEESFAKNKISYSSYYNSSVDTITKYYKQGKIKFSDYKDFMSESAKTLFSTMGDMYEKGKYSTKTYYNALIKYANIYKKKGILTYKEYYDYIEQANKALAESYEKVKDKQDNVLSALQLYSQQKQDNIQAQIDALNEEDDELERQNQLIELQQNLLDARQQKIRVWSESEGWHFEENTKAIKEAQDALDEYNKTQEKEQKISALEKEKEKWANIVDYYSDQQSQLELEMKLGTTIEKAIFGKSSQTYSNFAKKYLSTTQKIIDAEYAIQKIEDSGYKLQKGVSTTKAPKVVKMASGTSFLKESGIVNYNEEGEELIVPPKGNLSYFQKGTGIVPADLTENLMELGKYTPNSLMQKLEQNTSNKSIDNSSVITIQNLSVETDDVDDFIRQLKNIAIL